MNDFTKWDSGGLTQGAADLRNAYRAIKDELDDLESTLEAKLEYWEGDARSAYSDAKSDWNKATDELNDILERLGLAVNNINDNYTATERSNSGIFG